MSLFFVVSGPSGVGKDSVIDRLRPLEPGIHYCVTATTRPRRPGERHGVDYYFVTESEFERLKASGELLEWARVHDQWKGLPCRQVREALEEQRDVLANVDVQGALTVRSKIASAILIFLAPGDLDELRRRLVGRGTESADELELRLANAHDELARASVFEYVVYNREGQLEAAVEEVRAIMRAERSRVTPRHAVLTSQCGDPSTSSG